MWQNTFICLFSAGFLQRGCPLPLLQGPCPRLRPCQGDHPRQLLRRRAAGDSQERGEERRRRRRGGLAVAASVVRQGAGAEADGQAKVAAVAVAAAAHAAAATAAAGRQPHTVAGRRSGAMIFCKLEKFDKCGIYNLKPVPARVYCRNIRRDKTRFLCCIGTLHEACSS